MTLSAAIPFTAEAVSPIAVILNVGRIASGFARVNRAVQSAAAGTSGFFASPRKIFIEFKKEFIKTGITEQGLIQNIVSFTLAS